jgi:hypothetical protein
VSRIPEGQARRLDRLALRAHCFHRYAHHPLCQAYRGEVLRFGRLRICKGCTLLAMGAVAGLGLGLSIPVLHLECLMVLALAGMAWVAVIFKASWVRRLGKAGTRLLPSLAGAFLVIQGLRFRDAWGWGLASALCLGAGLAGRIYRCRGPWHAPCEACPERVLRPCSGFRLQFRRERAFARLAGRLLAAEGQVADGKMRPLD